MTTQTNEQRVKDVWPDAAIKRVIGYPKHLRKFVFAVYPDGNVHTGSQISNWSSSSQAAWQNAADNLTDKNKVDV